MVLDLVKLGISTFSVVEPNENKKKRLNLVSKNWKYQLVFDVIKGLVTVSIVL